jgi:hypothetical protein
MEGDEDDNFDAEDADQDVEEEADLMADDSTRANGLPSGDATFAQLSPLLEPLLHLAHPTALSFPPPDGPSPHPPTTSALGAVHVCALECLNNLFLGLAAAQRPAISANAQAGTSVWNQVWAALQAVGTVEGRGQERRRDMWENGVGVLWGISNVWKGVLVGTLASINEGSRLIRNIQVPQEDQVRVLMQLCDNSKDDAMRVKCIGTLECLAQHPDAVDANRASIHRTFTIRSH